MSCEELRECTKQNEERAKLRTSVGSRCPPDFQQVLFVQAGTGCDQHGQNATKAAARACRQAIEFNSIPSLRTLVPGGHKGLKLQDTVDCKELEKVFPYGTACFEVVEGGLLCNSGIAIPEMGDKSDAMLIAVAAVTVGY